LPTRKPINEKLALPKFRSEYLQGLKIFTAYIKKMQRQEKPFHLYRIYSHENYSDTEEHCYQILSIVQSEFEIVENSFTDYISGAEK
jgi:(p)ppGpp synthase/HD superfamily hydrolase